MCNLYSMTKTREAVGKLFRVSHNRMASFDPSPAIFPGQEAPVVRLAEDGERELVTMSWGFVLPQKDKAPKRVTNARDDKVRSSPFWRGSFEQRRCLVPVTSFAEPKGRRPAIWHWFALNDARPVFAFAGLWRPWNGPLKKDGEAVPCDVYAFLTTTPNALVKPIHPTRMPVMLTSAEDCDLWLSGSTEDAYRLARPYPADEMEIVYKGDTKDQPAMAV